jgi:hypothetical protein
MSGPSKPSSPSPKKIKEEQAQEQAGKVTVNRTCLSCNDGKKGLYSLFKTACLNYE